MNYNTLIKNHKFKSISDGLLVAIFMSTAFIMAMSYLQQYRHAGNEPFFYQSEFEPAVMLACGHGFGVEVKRTSETLSRFLKLESQSFDCADLPNNPELKTNTHHQAWRYMLSAAAAVWRISGEVNWVTLDVLPSIFFALSVAALYGLFRLAGGQILASLGLLVSSQYVKYLPFLRDYSKAPFILFAVLLLMWLVIKAKSFRSQVALSLLIGIDIGVGYGFRPDVLIMLPLVIVGIVFFVRSMRRTDLGHKMFLVGTFFVAFVVVSWPIINSAKESGSGTFHFPLLGLGSQFTTDMKLVGSSYEWMYQFNDQLAHAMVISHGIRNHSVEGVGYCTPEYDKISGDLYRSLVMTFPADMMTRAVASVLQVLNNPFNFSWLVVLASLFILTAAKPAIGLFSGILVFYLAAYPAIQFHPRHFFHLYFIPIMAAIFLSQQAFDHRNEVLGVFRLEPGSRRSIWLSLRRAVLIFLGIGIAAIVVFMVARQYQVRQVEQIVESYTSHKDWQSVPMAQIDERDEMAYFPIKIFDVPSGGITGGNPRADTAMLRIRLTNFNGLLEKKSVIVAYRSASSSSNFTRDLDLTPFIPSGGGIVYVPLYMFSGYKGYRPERLEVPVEMLRCTEEFEVSVGRPEQKLWIEFLLPYDWRKRPLYQQIGIPPPPPIKPYHRYPEDLPLSFKQAKALMSSLEPAAALQPIDIQSEMVSLLEGEITVDGKATTPYSYLFQLPGEKLKDEPRVFLIEGELFKGGLTVGMIKDDRWASQINVTGHGKFVLAIEHSQGIYVPTVANNVPGDPSNHFVIRRMGWIDSAMYQSEAGNGH